MPVPPASPDGEETEGTEGSVAGCGEACEGAFSVAARPVVPVLSAGGADAGGRGRVPRVCAHEGRRERRRHGALAGGRRGMLAACRRGGLRLRSGDVGEGS